MKQRGNSPCPYVKPAKLWCSFICWLKLCVAAEATLVSELGFVPTGTQQQCSCSSHCWLTDAARYTISLLYTSLLLLCAAALPIAMVAAILWPRSNLSVGLVAATILCLLLLLRKVVTKQPTVHVLTDPWLVWPREHRSVMITPKHVPFVEYSDRVRQRVWRTQNEEKVTPSEWVDLGLYQLTDHHQLTLP